jgi:hypothetical protein
MFLFTVFINFTYPNLCPQDSARYRVPNLEWQDNHEQFSWALHDVEATQAEQAAADAHVVAAKASVEDYDGKTLVNEGGGQPMEVDASDAPPAHGTFDSDEQTVESWKKISEMFGKPLDKNEDPWNDEKTSCIFMGKCQHASPRAHPDPFLALTRRSGPFPDPSINMPEISALVHDHIQKLPWASYQMQNLEPDDVQDVVALTMETMAHCFSIKKGVRANGLFHIQPTPGRNRESRTQHNVLKIGVSKPILKKFNARVTTDRFTFRFLKKVSDDRRKRDIKYRQEAQRAFEEAAAAELEKAREPPGHVVKPSDQKELHDLWANAFKEAAAAELLEKAQELPGHVVGPSDQTELRKMRGFEEESDVSGKPDGEESPTVMMGSESKSKDPVEAAQQTEELPIEEGKEEIPSGARAESSFSDAPQGAVHPDEPDAEEGSHFL